jgi:hypothetical protein
MGIVEGGEEERDVVRVESGRYDDGGFPGDGGGVV